MTRLALHLNNSPFAGDDLRRIVATGVREFVDLSDYRVRWPSLPGLVHARVNVRGPLGDPDEEASLFSAAIRSGTAATWRYRNEPNIESPGTTPYQWLDWLEHFGKRARALQPNTAVFAPAISPGTADWLNWLDATTEAAWGSLFDGLDVHAYGTPDEVRAVLEVTRRWWPKPRRLIITEHNFGAGRDYSLTRYVADIPAVMQACAEYDVEVLGLFIWYWNRPDSHLITPVDVRGSVVEWALQNVAKEVAGVPDYTFTLGFAAYAAAHPEIGQPTGPLLYDMHGNGLQYTETGKLEWNKAGDQVLFFRAAGM